MNPELVSPETEASTDEEIGEKPDEEPDLRVVELPAATGAARIGLPADADEPEAVAIAAAVAAHLGAEADEADDVTDLVDPWSLCARLGLRDPTHVSAECERGEEWKIAGRSVGR